ncbi:MAG: hypothetical protein HY855_08565 [Burkholderiales bacterium]|nr:hypothetical protein [Burkholderiales bacterium]
MNLKKWGDALAWRVRARVGDQRIDNAILHLARLWRPLLRRPTFIALAGSAGKTTAKELLAGILATHQRGVANPGTFNMLQHLGQTLLKVAPWHHHCVMELSEDQPGVMDRMLPLLKPSIAVMTVVRDDHLAAFGSRDQLVHEMLRVVQCLPPEGMAVLNADDPVVLGMAAQCRARVLTFGTAAGADLRADEIQAAWPRRLTMTLHFRGQRLRVATRLCGEHWVPSVLGAVGGALACGLTLEACAAALAAVEPFEGRMQPVVLADGVTFMRDDFKAPCWGIDASVAFLRDADARRKVVVLGELSEVRSGKSATYKAVARQLLAVADEVVVVGPWATEALAASGSVPGRRVVAFMSVQQASDHVNAQARPGDLVLLKGSIKQDHLQRILLARLGRWTCWIDDCRMIRFCATCSEKDRASPQAAAVQPAPLPLAEGGPLRQPPVAADEWLVVGLGNDGPAYQDTPHNIGFDLVDHLARAHGLVWQQDTAAWVARGRIGGRALCLLKLRTLMNLSGPTLQHIARAAGISARQIVLVHDDLHLPLGTVKARAHGGAGGHKGVASVLGSFQTDAIRRIKIGVAPAVPVLDLPAYVVAPWPEALRPVLEQSLVLAVDRLLTLKEAEPAPQRPPAAPVAGGPAHPARQVHP